MFTSNRLHQHTSSPIADLSDRLYVSFQSIRSMLAVDVQEVGLQAVVASAGGPSLSGPVESEAW